ncbi:uncharacterized protein [Drosophila takahashii]|uniref:uncharacterized protein n=1 Tax=Drosophila takahashii TaxID=29030 RepID=UPI001CF8F8B8|nr:uncharacterized protein LOC108057260 [Drosophila takahashii]
MSDLNECALDRHFTAQLRDLRSYSKEHPVSQEDFEISQRWMNHFKEARGHDKFARNCLMLLLCNQLREIGHLTKPFTEMESMNRPLDDLVNEYKAKTVEDQQPADDDDDEISNSSCYQEVAAEEPLPSPRFESIKQANQNLLREIESLHSRAVETEKLYRSRNQVLAKKMAEKSKTGKPEFVQENLNQACRSAIGLLKDWPGETVRLHFLATCLEPLLRNELVVSSQIAELDIKLEDTLNSLVLQACTRRDDNVRMLYEHVLTHDKFGLREKEEKLRRFHESLRQERQRLRLLSEDLRRREDLIWRHQAIATLAVTGLPAENPGSPGHSRCDLCQGERSFRPGTEHPPTSGTRNSKKSEGAEDLQKLTETLSDLSADKW